MPKTTGYASAVEQGVHETSSVARAKLGEKVQTADGRVYRYAKNAGTALAAGKLCVAATPVANHTNIAVAAAADVGATSITVTLGATAAAANLYAEGFVVVNDAAGEGIAYKIKDHGAGASAGDMVINLEDPIVVALTTSSEVSLVKNTYDSVVISATDQADLAVGIPNVAVAADEFFWLQTGGTCSALADEAITAGLSLTIGTSVAGAVEAADLVGEQVIGVATDAAVDTEYRRIELRIDN